MQIAFIVEWSMKRWFSEVWSEFYQYFIAMNPTHWMIISACGVFFGFLCLRGTGIK